jgi:hypothetical protein
MARADWTYELPPVTGDSVWLEEYLVYDRDGEPAGKVFAVLERDGQQWLGIEREHLPLLHDRRVVPFDQIRETDHENLAVHLALDADEIDGALELDPDKGVEQGGAARRIVDVPRGELPRLHDAGAPGRDPRGAARGALRDALAARRLHLLGREQLVGCAALLRRPGRAVRGRRAARLPRMVASLDALGRGAAAPSPHRLTRFSE